MIKKIIVNLFLVFLLALILSIVILSTSGVKTDKFNKLIENKIAKSKNIKLQLQALNFKLDLGELSLFIETQNPEISYVNLDIPAQNIKIYLDFLPLLKTDLKIKKINIILNELNFSQINELSKFIKPSNVKSFINNKIKKAKLISEIELFLNNNGELKDYIIKGKVSDLKIDLSKDLILSKTNLSFFADKDDILIKNIFGNLDGVEINNGDIKLNLENGVKLNSSFISNINLDGTKTKKINVFLKKFNFLGNIKELNGNLNNSIFINFDKTYKITNYDYKLSGKLNKSKIELITPTNNNFFVRDIKAIYLADTQIDFNINKKKFNISTLGKYSLNNSDFLQLELNSNFTSGLLKIDTNFDYKENFNLDLINYKKPKHKIAKVSIELEKDKNIISVKKLDFREKNNFISISNLKFKDNNFESLNKLNISTINNDFFIQWDKKIKIKGSKFDATNLPKLLTQKGTSKKFKNINTSIEIDFKNIKAPLSEKLENFRLIGEIKKGEFTKISSKGDFGGNNFLDISLKKDNDSEKKFFEIYSDLTRPLLTEYSFFKGLTGGKLLFTSLIDGSKSNSKLKIENFKVVNAPGVIKLLSLADLGGLADLTEGEGLSFDLLEIDMEKDESILKLNEILALGPSMSVLIEGYQDNTGLTSLKGTLVPAKTLNKIISKIPVIGNIVIPKEVGEGLFGVSFKMKGPKGDVKTTINPIRTLTPRFIQKIVDKNKVSK
tara:strand:- start:731 stop:2905 length:2175 start_codon:yes stop_codon:yes gene_type:complete